MTQPEAPLPLVHSTESQSQKPEAVVPMCLDFPLRRGYMAQIVIPRDMTASEADRLCAFVMSLAQ